MKTFINWLKLVEAANQGDFSDLWVGQQYVGSRSGIIGALMKLKQLADSGAATLTSKSTNIGSIGQPTTNYQSPNNAVQTALSNVKDQMDDVQGALDPRGMDISKAVDYLVSNAVQFIQQNKLSQAVDKLIQAVQYADLTNPVAGVFDDED